jgi:hypothetical protein
VALLLEARQVFILGYSYACVAMCGIAAERIVKDRLRASLRVEKDGKVQMPPDRALDQLEYVEIRGIACFLRESGSLSERAFGAADDLGRLRNKYAHARGKQPEADAVEAIKLLHVLVDETVHVSLD